MQKVIKIRKTWSHVHFGVHGGPEVEIIMNYETKNYCISSEDCDQSVSFNNEDENIEASIDKARCVMSALQYIKKEIID